MTFDNNFLSLMSCQVVNGQMVPTSQTNV